MAVVTARIYDSPERRDTHRVLVDRLWPRGLAKDAVDVDIWLKEVAPSTELRRWFGHDPNRFAEFAERYRAELADNPAFEELRRIVAEHEHVTLLYAAKDTEHNQAVVLAELLG